jgi:hypothetical protein
VLVYWALLSHLRGFLKIHPSAREHGLPEQDIRHAATQFLIAYSLTDSDNGPDANCAWVQIAPATCSKSSCYSWTTTMN